jgi:eukaryotic-like serine/threonine-protein kinase
LTGRPPFESEALGELMGMILYDDMPVPSQRCPDLPKELDAWWSRAAARDREQRFESAKDLADALGIALGAARPVVVPSVAPRRISLTEIDAVLATDGRETDAPLTNTRISSSPGVPRGFVSRIRARFGTSRMWIRRVPRRHLAAAAVVAGIVAGAALTFVMTSGSSTPTTAAAPVAPAELSEPRRAAPGPSVFVDESAPIPSPSTTVKAPPAASSSAPAPSSSSTADGGSSKRPSSKGYPAGRVVPVKKAPKARDYGI